LEGLLLNKHSVALQRCNTIRDQTKNYEQYNLNDTASIARNISSVLKWSYLQVQMFLLLRLARRSLHTTTKKTLDSHEKWSLRNSWFINKPLRGTTRRENEGDTGGLKVDVDMDYSSSAPSATKLVSAIRSL
jgi:hypothetical protein